MEDPRYSAIRAPGHEHIPLYPRGFIAVRIIQLILAVLILGLSAFAVWYLPYDGNAFMLAIAVMAIIAGIYHLVAKYGAPYVYNYWAVLGLDIFFIIMWLCAFALQASRVARYFTSTASSYYDYYDYGDYSDYYYVKRNTYAYPIAWLACQAAAAAFGGFSFVLHIVALIIHSIRLHRHRRAGLHCMPGMPRTMPSGGGNTTAAAIPMGPYAPAEKAADPVPVYPHHQPAQPYQQQQQGGYPAQNGFYPPHPSQSPPPQLVAQPTGGSFATSHTGGMQSPMHAPVPMPANHHQLPAN